MGIGQLRSVDETEADTVGRPCERHDAVRRPWRGAITDDKEVVIVVNQFHSSRKPPTQFAPARAQQLCYRWIELRDKRCHLPSGRWRSGARLRRHNQRDPTPKPRVERGCRRLLPADAHRGRQGPLPFVLEVRVRAEERDVQRLVGAHAEPNRRIPVFA